MKNSHLFLSRWDTIESPTEGCLHEILGIFAVFRKKLFDVIHGASAFTPSLPQAHDLHEINPADSVKNKTQSHQAFVAIFKLHSSLFAQHNTDGSHHHTR